MPNKKISALPINTSPTFSDVFPIVNSGVTKKLSLSGLTTFIKSDIGPKIIITGGTYDNNTGTATFINSTGGTFDVTGFTTNVKHWVEGQDKVIADDETIVISENYVLNNSNLILQSGGTQFYTGNLVFNKTAQIFIGGYLLLVDSAIINNGLISVGGAIILLGNSNITGNGTII